MNNVFFVVYHCISFIRISINNINQAAVLSEGNAREGKKIRCTHFKMSVPKTLGQ